MPHPRTLELLEYLDRERAALAAAVESVPRADRERRPAPDRWSVANVLEHLSIVESRTAAVLSAKLAEAKAQGLGPETESASILGAHDTARYRDRSRRIQTGEASEPKGGLDADAAWAALGRSRAQIRTLLADADGFGVSTITHPHPRFGPFSLYEWMVFLGGHDARHALQIEETGRQLRPAGGTREP